MRLRESKESFMRLYQTFLPLMFPLALQAQTARMVTPSEIQATQANYVMNRADASAINYEDGKKVNLSEAMNLYTPGNQNDGVQQYNDRALLQMDKSLNRDTYFKKAKLYKYIGIIGGAALIATGVILIPTVAKDHSGKLDPSVTVPSYFLIGVGAAGGVACILVANRYRNLGNMIQSTSLMHHEMKFDNGSSLMAGIDVLKDNYTRQQTLGLGLRYNF